MFPKPNEYCSDQLRETPLHQRNLGNVTMKALYARSRDSQLLSQAGQDYFKVMYGRSRSGRPKIAFALCDGVGNSFMGQLGARLLGDALCKLLWSDVSFMPPSSAEKFTFRLVAGLARNQASMAKGVDDFQLTSDLPLLVRRALGEQRQYGSEAMFVCGLLLNHRWYFGWLGDVRLQLLDETNEPAVNFTQIPDTNSRWSSRLGLRGELRSLIFSRDASQHIRHILAFSDGLASVEQTLSQMSDDALTAVIRAQEQSPASDDISYLHFTLHNN